MVIKNLFIINGLFLLATFVFQYQLSIDLYDILGLHFPGSEKFRPYQLITYIFMHADIHHLVSNMISLWIFGAMLENYWGPKRFLVYYLLTGIGAAALHYSILYFHSFAPVLAQLNSYPGYHSPEQFIEFFNALPGIPFSDTMHILTENYNHILSSNPNPTALIAASGEILAGYRAELLNLPLIVGASGSVFGVLLAYGMIFPDSYPFLFIPIKAKWIVILYGASELYAELHNAPGDTVAHWGHLGGMLFGFILIKYWQRKSNRFY
jgi:membrane associated rhomboid family serine protease